MRHWPVPLVAVHDFSGDQCGQRGLLAAQLTCKLPSKLRRIGLRNTRANRVTHISLNRPMGSGQRLPIEGGLLRPWVLAQASAR